MNTKNNNEGLYFYPNEHLSISALKSFENCPWGFHARYYLGLKADEKDAVTFGKQFQDLLNAKYRRLDTEPLLEVFSKKQKGLAKLLLTKSYDFEDVISVDQPYKVDLGFGIPFMFVPDLLTKTTLVENKTTAGYYNSNMIKDEKQATVYYVGVRKEFGFTPEIKYQLFNTKDQSCQLLDSPRTGKDIDDLMDWIEATLKQIEKCYNTGRWDTGKHKFCNYKNVCELQEIYGFQR